MTLHIVEATAPAKINLCLGVGNVRPDGFHPLATVYQAVALHDSVIVRSTDEEKVTVEVAGDRRLFLEDVPTDERNIAVKAARLLMAHHGLDPATSGVHIAIEKGIPVAGGMAGGSADAAATLVACDALWELHTPREELMHIAAELGSDVPFGLVGGTAIGSGRGEIVTPVMTRGDYWWVVLESLEGMSTPAVYSEFDVLHGPDYVHEPELPDALMHALRSHDMASLGAALSNDLQDAALRLRPELASALQEGLLNTAHGAILSGSGPSCLFLCDGQQHAAHVAAALEHLGPVSYARGPVPGAHVVAAER